MAPSVSDQPPQESELMELDSKRLCLQKPGELKSVNSTQITSLFFDCPNQSTKDEFYAESSSYNVTFTYPFFGQEEELKGVEEASLKICFDPSSFYAFIDFDLDDQLLKEPLQKKLTDMMANDGWTCDWNEYHELAEKARCPPSEMGSLVKSLEHNGKKYNIYKCDFTNEKFRKFHERLQILLLFFIEASSYIDDEDVKWQCYLMFAEDENGNEYLVGYTTLYPFLYFPDKIRMRLSQFLILPPYLRLGLGSQLYKQVYESILASDEIMELTVEDPSPEFAAFRLSNDLPVFQAANEKSQKALKFSEPEFEMLQQLDEFIQNDYKDSKDFRLKVKKSLWRRNKDTLPEEGDAAFKEALAELYEERLDLFKNVLKL